MQYTTAHEAQQHFAEWCSVALNDREIIVVQQEDGQKIAFLAADELEGLLETAHLLHSPANAARLLTALRRAQERRDVAETPGRLRDDMGI
jgi:antitoxin YefM